MKWRAMFLQLYFVDGVRRLGEIGVRRGLDKKFGGSPTSGKTGQKWGTRHSVIPSEEDHSQRE